MIVTDRARPEPLFVAFFIGVNRLVRVDFDLTQRPVTFLRQALDGVREKLSESAVFLGCDGAKNETVLRS